MSGPPKSCCRCKLDVGILSGIKKKIRQREREIEKMREGESRAGIYLDSFTIVFRLLNICDYFLIAQIRVGKVTRFSDLL